MKKIYITLSAHFIQPNDLKMIEKACALGHLTVGLLTDEVFPLMGLTTPLSFGQRKLIVESMKGVSLVIPQFNLEPLSNIEKIKPDIVIHKNDWNNSGGNSGRQRIIKSLEKWGGKLIEISLEKPIQSQQLQQNLSQEKGTTPQQRLSSLRRLIQTKPLVRIIEVHNGLCGLIAENVKIESGLELKEFDGMWESSLTDSTSKGKPDNSSVDMTSRIQSIDQILDVTTKPMVVDGDNGGFVEHFQLTVRTLERLGISAIIIEDKVGPKKNSLFGTDVEQFQDTAKEFSKKIKAGKLSQVTKDFMIIARIESLILKKGLKDALIRAESYIEAGADAIMIHSKSNSPDEIVNFCKSFKTLNKQVPLVVAPSTYATISEDQLIEHGIKIVIYANHLIRSAFPAMVETARSILKEGRCYEASERYCMPIGEILNLVPEATLQS